MNRFLLQIPLQLDEAATHSSQDGYRTAPLQNRYKGLEKYCSTCADVCVLPASINGEVAAVVSLSSHTRVRFGLEILTWLEQLHDRLMHARMAIVLVMPIT
jgi:hypothetical protein